MFQVFTLLVTSPGLLAAVGALLVTGAFLLAFPLRGGHGRHAAAGPGALTVSALTEVLAEREVRAALGVDRIARGERVELSEIGRYLLEMMREMREVEPVRRRGTPQRPSYVGKHRLRFEPRIDIRHRPVNVTLNPALIRPH